MDGMKESGTTRNHQEPRQAHCLAKPQRHGAKTFLIRSNLVLSAVQERPSLLFSFLSVCSNVVGTDGRRLRADSHIGLCATGPDREGSDRQVS